VSELALRIENVGKRYAIGGPNSHRTLRDHLSRRIRDAARWPRRRRAPKETLWALRHVTFDVTRGEAVGVVGANGAGKSTLLKILSRITPPTTGRVQGFGRVSSLLEVGTGFHPELTGRENVFFNGAVMGMRRAEIARKFDEIVTFSDVERFLDTPIKHYSSGMHVRLAFAVAAHLDPEILIVDEALAVGDAAFQKRCVAKMGEIRRSGRTVLFVSHNMGLIHTLCDRTLLLERGELVADDRSAATVALYLKGLEEAASHDLLERADRRGTGEARLARIDVTGGGGDVATGRPARFDFHVTAPARDMTCSFTIYDQMGRPVTYFDSAVPGTEDESADTAGFSCEVDDLTLVPGRYRVNAELARGSTVLDHVEGAAFFDVGHGALQGRPAPRDGNHGNVLLRHRWLAPHRNP
jgi:lipopolysaccharide transport system ATP-binding protein